MRRDRRRGSVGEASVRVVAGLDKVLEQEVRVVGVGDVQLEHGEVGDLGAGAEQGPRQDEGLDGVELDRGELGEGDDGGGVEEHDLVGGVAEEEVEGERGPGRVVLLVVEDDDAERKRGGLELAEEGEEQLLVLGGDAVVGGVGGEEGEPRDDKDGAPEAGEAGDREVEGGGL